VLVALALLVGIIGGTHPDFLKPLNVFQIMGNSAFYGMIALGMVFLLALGEIDLSVGWNFNFSAVIAAKAMVAGVDPWIAVALGTLFGAGLGMVNGVFSVGLGLPVIIVTLGTFSMFQGLSLVINKSQAIVPPDTSGSFFDFANAKFFTVLPSVAIVFAVLAVVLHLVLHHTRFGYRVQAIGSNPEAARLAGIPAGVTKILALILVGAICGFAGALFVGARGAIDPSTGATFMLTVVAAAIIGGTPLSGGAGTVLGALVGALIIAVISSGIIFFGVDATWSTFVTGAVIVLAVSIDKLVRRQRALRAAGGGL
jgi:ribose transport system permease protein